MPAEVVYYADEFVTLYHGDARVVLPTLPLCDLLLTDPPYGIKADTGQKNRAGKQPGRSLAPSRDYGVSDWDAAPPPRWLMDLAIDSATWAVIWGGNFFTLPPARCWLVWDKDNGSNDYADCELAWTNFDKPVRKITYRWHGMLQEPGAVREFREHPTQKPEAVMRWALSQAPDPIVSVLDPFAGTGTTLVEAKRVGKKAIGIEREERYCEMAARRLAQGSLAAMFA